MQKIATFLLLFSGMYAYAQPVIPNGNNMVNPGYTGDVMLGVYSNNPGPAGANQTWDFSTQSFSKIGDYEVMNCASVPFIASYPTVNKCTRVVPVSGSPIGTNNLYILWNVLADKLENVTALLAAPGSGNEYVQNPKTRLKFPFNFGDTDTDTYQKTGNTPSSVTITYDGYGTLLVPGYTFNNIVRVKSQYSSDTDYDWWQLNPLDFVMSAAQNSSNLVVIKPNQPNAIEDLVAELGFSFYPNPVQDQLTIESNKGLAIEHLSIHNLSGQCVKTIAVNGEIKVQASIGELPQGIYTFKILLGGKALAYNFLKM